MNIGQMIEELLASTDLSNQEIVDKVKEKFPDAKTTTKSVASIASVARKYGRQIAKRPTANPYDRIKELEARVAELEELLEMNDKEEAA